MMNGFKPPPLPILDEPPTGSRLLFIKQALSDM